MTQPEIHIALVLLENRQGQFALQLRSNIPSIPNPDRWGFFGGHIEEGESAEDGALREIHEELDCRLNPSRLQAVERFRREPNTHYSVFHYAVEHELNQAELHEGEDFDLFDLEQILSGQIRGKEVVSYHLALLQRFLAARK